MNTWIIVISSILGFALLAVLLLKYLRYRSNIQRSYNMVFLRIRVPKKESKEDREVEAADQQLVEAFATTGCVGGSTFQDVNEHPALQPTSVAWHAEPTGLVSSTFQHVVCRFKGCHELATAASKVDRVGKANKAAAVHTVAVKAFDEINRVCEPRPNETVDGKEADPPGNASRLCFLANRCVCGELGGVIVQRFGKLAMRMKAVWKGELLHKELQKGHAVAVIIGRLVGGVATRISRLRFSHRRRHFLTVRVRGVGA